MPGVVSRIDWADGSRPSPRRRSTRPCSPKAGIGIAGGGVERIEILVHGHEQPALGAALPEGHAAIGPPALEPGVEAPLARAGRRVEGHHAVRRGGRVHHPVDDDRVDLEPAGFPGVEAPRLFEPIDVGGGDLAQRRVAIAGVRAAVDGPLARRRRVPGGCRPATAIGRDRGRRGQGGDDAAARTHRRSIRRAAPTTDRPARAGRSDRSVPATRRSASPWCSRSPR